MGGLNMQGLLYIGVEHEGMNQADLAIYKTSLTLPL